MIKKIVVALGVLSVVVFADIYDLKPMKITKDITCVIGDINPPTKENNGFVSNMCFVDMGDTLVVLDSGPTYKFAKEFHTLMQKLYPDHTISHVILSNYHDDRVQGASYFKQLGAKIVGHTTINEDIKTNPSKFERMKRILPKEIVEGTKVIHADTLVDGGDTIQGLTKTLEIIKPSVVSEEQSDIAIYSKDDSFLFVGNIVFNGRLLSYKNSSNIDGWIEAIENLAKMDVEHFLGGHGSEYHKDSYKPSLEYLQILRADVKQAYEDGVELMDVKKYVKTDKFNYMNHFDQLNSLNISAYYNQLEWE
jgi:glyoxylase-like metal-dependent hydrolase (beta-lactamase superfamily II)